MGAELLEGKVVALKIKEGLILDIEKLKTKKIIPRLVSVQIGENPSCEVYIKSQIKTADSLGIGYELKKLDTRITQEELMGEIKALNNDRDTDGIIVQLPLPSHIDIKAIRRCISPDKDVEGMHPQNMGEIVFGNPRVLPCTPAACMELIGLVPGLELYGKQAVIVGHSEIVGKPLALLLLNKFVTVTVCHIATGERGTLPEFVRQAEILIVAVGKPGLIKGEWIREGAIVIDVGINKVGDRIIGDVEFEEAKKRASYITPVPGGVGPLTVTLLMRNLIQLIKVRQL